MPLDKFEGKIAVKTREQVRDEWLESYKLWKPDADTGPKSFPFIEASAFADGQMASYANAEYFGDATSPFTTRGKALDEELAAAGAPRKPATGAIGWVTVATSSGGSNVVQGDLLKYKASGKLYQALQTQAVVDGQEIVVQCVSTGPDTNVAAGSELEWRSPRPGMSKIAVVFENTDGSGLSGGALEETDEEAQQRLADLRQHPAVAGNDAEVIQFVEKITGIAIQKAFCYSAVNGPGTKSVFFTMRPSVPGGSRVPSGAVVALVESMIKDAFPWDDGIFVGSFTEEEIAPIFQVTWKAAAPSFVDAAPWPAYASDPVAVDGAVAIGATQFRATTSVDTTTPAVGQSIGLYDADQRKFVRKVISAVAVIVANRSWTLTFSSSSALSDKAFVPADGALISAWSDSLDETVAPTLAYFDRQGPGELFASFPDPGRRKRRFPPPEPDVWPSRIENRIVDGLFAVVADAELAAPAVPLSAPVGTPPLIAALHRLSDLCVLPQT